MEWDINSSDAGFSESTDGISDQFHKVAASDRSRTGAINDPSESSQQGFDITLVFQGAVLDFC